MNSENFFKKFNNTKKRVEILESKMRMAFEKYQLASKEYLFEIRELQAMRKMKESVIQYEEESVKKFFEK